MKLLQLIQGTDEWLIARLEHLTASEAPAMMDASKFMSRNELLSLKAGWKSNPNSSFKEALFQDGHDFEEAARPLAEAELFEDLMPLVGSLEVEGLLLLASYDGLTEDHSIAWEHKMWNLVLAENARNGVLEPHYYWQLEHQLLVSKSEHCVFTVSDGTANNYVSMEYRSTPERRADLIAGWLQFESDLAKHELVAKVEVLTVEKSTNDLPILSFEVKGTEIVSNCKNYLSEINQLASFEMARTLETDGDFAAKHNFNKDVKIARSRLKDAGEEVKGQFASYKVFSATVDDIDATLRKMLAHGEKQVESGRAAKKLAIQNTAEKNLLVFLSEIRIKINPVLLEQVHTVTANFTVAMKNKRTIESLQGAVDDELARVKIEVNGVADLVELNLESLRTLAEKHSFLFNDTPLLVVKQNEDLINLIESRIGKHEAEQIEQKRLEQVRIEAAAKVKAEREAAAKLELEAQAIRDEERKKIEAEQKLAAEKLAKEKAEVKPDFIQVQEKQAEIISTEIDKAIEKPVAQKLAERFKNIKCDGNHGGPKCQDPDCWNDDKETRTSVDKEVSPIQQEVPRKVVADRQANANDVAVFLSSVGPDEINAFGNLLVSGDSRLEGEAVHNLKVAFHKFMQQAAA